MQILSDFDLYSFQTKMEASYYSSTFLDKVSTGPCHQQNFGHDSRGYTNMIKSNFAL